jgi:hypothetical protein
MRYKSIGMEIKMFKEISTRGRVAFAICCLENVIKKQNLVQNDESEKTILQQLWHFTTDNIALWELQVRELIPYVIMEDVSYEIKDFDFFSLKFHNKLQTYYKKCYPYLLEIINLIYELGRTNLYVAINSEKLKEVSLPHLQDIIDLMEKNDIQLPDIGLFKKISITENYGWGRTFTREDIFRNDIV